MDAKDLAAKLLRNHFTATAALIVLSVLALLSGCGPTVGSIKTPSPRTVEVLGTVESICAECDTADLVGGGAVAWDVVTVRVTSPQDVRGQRISVEVLVEHEANVQRLAYQQSSGIRFTATEGAIASGRVMLHASDIAPDHPVGP